MFEELQRLRDEMAALRREKETGLEKANVVSVRRETVEITDEQLQPSTSKKAVNEEESAKKVSELL